MNYWTPRRRRQLGRRVRIALDCSGAVWETDGICAAVRCLAAHIRTIEADYPADWRDIAAAEGVI